MVKTYAGVLEGTKKVASQYIREDLPRMVSNIMPPGQPLAIIEPPVDELPDWLCVAKLESYLSVHNNGPDFNSRLYVCWFLEDTTRSLDEIIESVIPQIEWENFSEDYDMMNF